MNMWVNVCVCGCECVCVCVGVCVWVCAGGVCYVVYIGWHSMYLQATRHGNRPV